MRTNSCIHRCAAGVLALGLIGTAGTASAQQTVVVPESEHTVSRGPSAYLFSSGLITTGLSYTPALIVAVNSDRSEDKYLYAPFAGPWMDLAARNGDGSKVDKTLLVVDGVFQTIGAIQIIASFFFTGSTETAKSDDSTSLASQTVVAPARVGDAYGLVAVGSF